MRCTRPWRRIHLLISNDKPSRLYEGGDRFLQSRCEYYVFTIIRDVEANLRSFKTTFHSSHSVRNNVRVKLKFVISQIQSIFNVFM